MQIWQPDKHYIDKNNPYYARIKTDVSSQVYILHVQCYIMYNAYQIVYQIDKCLSDKKKTMHNILQQF